MWMTRSEARLDPTRIPRAFAALRRAEVLPVAGAPGGTWWEMHAMAVLQALGRSVPPPSPEKMAAGKRRLLALAEQRRRERLIDLAG